MSLSTETPPWVREQLRPIWAFIAGDGSRVEAERALLLAEHLLANPTSERDPAKERP